MSDEAFEKWRSEHTDMYDHIGDVRVGWEGAISEMSKPQGPETCKHEPPHKVSALVYRREYPENWNEPEVAACSICDEIEAAVAHTESLLRGTQEQLRLAVGVVQSEQAKVTQAVHVERLEKE